MQPRQPMAAQPPRAAKSHLQLLCAREPPRGTTRLLSAPRRWSLAPPLPAVGGDSNFGAFQGLEGTVRPLGEA
eukprot:787730-Alexandrium_andersonii.AAC.1